MFKNVQCKTTYIFIWRFRLLVQWYLAYKDQIAKYFMCFCYYLIKIYNFFKYFCNYLCHYLLRRKINEHNNQNKINNNLFNPLDYSDVDGAGSEFDSDIWKVQSRIGAPIKKWVNYQLFSLLKLIFWLCALPTLFFRQVNW